MEGLTKVTLGLLLWIWGMVLLYRPAVVLKVYAFLRANLLNDAHILLYRRRWGLLLLVLAILMVYSGVRNLSPISTSQGKADPLANPLQQLADGHFVAARQEVHQIVRGGASTREAWLILGGAWAMEGNRDEAQRAWKRAAEIR